VQVPAYQRFIDFANVIELCPARDDEPSDAVLFLAALDPGARSFTFQTFDDNNNRKDPKLICILHGSFADLQLELERLNERGAGVFVTINETDGRGRKTENIERVRALFVDLDGAPLEPVLAASPHIVAESSPGRFHAYWLVVGMPLNDFSACQEAFIERFRSDRAVKDLPRVMRLPGFKHLKGKPFRSRIIRISKAPPYPASDFSAAMPPVDASRANVDPERRPNKKLEADDIEVLAAAVDVIPNDINGWEDWNGAMMAIWAATGGSEEGFKIADRWCAKWEGYDAKDTRQRWEAIGKSPPNRIGAGTIFYLADRASPGWRAALKPITRDDFVAYLPAHNYIFLPTREPWPASSVDSQIPPVPKLDKNGNAVLDKNSKPIRTPAHTWLDKHRPVQQMTWAPGSPVLIHDKLVADGGWIDRPGATCLNLYRPPTIKCGNAAEAKPWLDLVERVYPDDHRHIIRFLAHRVQQPGVKINHCLVLGGFPGIGKDTILEPVKHAVGPWNFSEVAPGDLFKPFNGYLKSVILRISEARDLGDVNRYSFYHHTKTLMQSRLLTSHIIPRNPRAKPRV
jgi:hypothetical protein